MKHTATLIIIVLGLCLHCFQPESTVADEGIDRAIARGGEAQLPVVISPDASQQVEENARHLARYLEKITGGTFRVGTGDGTAGIAVGNYEDFPELEWEQQFKPEDLTRRDEYLLRTHPQGIYLVGATDLAAQHAVWDFLHRLGYRRFFLTETWEIIPEDPNLNVALDVFEAPDYYDRNAPRGAPWSDGKMWKRWKDRNRVTSGMHLSLGHVYDSIIRSNQEKFDAHPEYLALVDGERGGNKFCISNEGLRQLVVQWAIRRVNKNPDIEAISMDPSDGGGWCECQECEEMGSVSDRVVILANAVAESINELEHGEKYVGIYAYYKHSPPRPSTFIRM